MLTLLGTIFGLLGSLAPDIIKYFKIKQDHKHELEVLKVQAAAAAQEHGYRLEEIQAQADVASEQVVYKAAEIKPTGVKWMDAIMAFYNASVRPTIAYSYFGMYAAVKYAMYQLYLENGISSYKAIVALWSDNDMAVFSTIMAFFYGGRFMKYAMNHFGTSVPQILDRVTNNKHSQPALKPVEPTPTPKPEEKPNVTPSPVDTTGR